ncbi:hypothetical protein PspLS_05093 [Pyricularia sp. CBS 133598]|nr:hypothetical protein PspLS_05093 [Pyricularia sp. CBS 133598]
METARKNSDSSNSGRCTSCAATRGSSIAEWHAEDCVGASETLMGTWTRSHEDDSSTAALNQFDHASRHVSYSNRVGQVDTSKVGSTFELHSFSLQAEPQQYSVYTRVDSPAPISRPQDRTSQQMVQDAPEYENPSPCGRRPPSVQLFSFCRDVEREDPRSVVARAAEAFPDVPDNVSEQDHEDLRAWEQHYDWDHSQASDPGPATVGDLWWEQVSPLSPSPSSGYGHGLNGK